MGRFTICVIFFLLQLIHSQSQSQITNTEDKRDFYIELSSKYAQDALSILTTRGLPQMDGLYAHDSTTQQLLMQYGTLIHESCHIHNIMHSPTGVESYFIDGNNQVQSKKGAYYNSNNLNKFVAKKLQTEISRYETYIGNRKELTSQENGIYGLIDEFSAYYHGGKAMFEALDYIEETQLSKENTEFMIYYLIALEYDLLAYYEFKLFISWYLQYAQKTNPYLFTDTFANTELRLAYTMLDNQYAILLKDYANKKKYFVQAISFVEPGISITRKDIRVKKGNVLKTYASYADEFNQLQHLLDAAPHQVLARFRLDDFEFNGLYDVVNP